MVNNQSSRVFFIVTYGGFATHFYYFGRLRRNVCYGKKYDNQGIYITKIMQKRTSLFCFQNLDILSLFICVTYGEIFYLHCRSTDKIINYCKTISVTVLSIFIILQSRYLLIYRKLLNQLIQMPSTICTVFSKILHFSVSDGPFLRK